MKAPGRKTTNAGGQANGASGAEQIQECFIQASLNVWRAVLVDNLPLIAAPCTQPGASMVILEGFAFESSLSLRTKDHRRAVSPFWFYDHLSGRASIQPIAFRPNNLENRLAIQQLAVRSDIGIVSGHHFFDQVSILL